MKSAILNLVCLAGTGFGHVTVLPPEVQVPRTEPGGSSTYGLAQRNASTTLDTLELNIDPHIVNPVCGGIYPATIDIEWAPDSFDLSEACGKFLSFLGGTHGQKKVDVVFACLGEPTNGTGNDSHIKIIFFILGNQDLSTVQKGEHNIAATMEVVDEAANFILSTNVDLGVKGDPSKDTSKFQYIYC